MTDIRRIYRLCAIAAVALMVAGGGDALRAQDLPEAEALIGRYQQALGGTGALDGRNTMRAKGRFSMPAAGLDAAFESYAARPNRTAMRVEIPGFGEIRSGYTGDTGWSMNPAEGPRLLESAEAIQAADEAAFESTLRTPQSIASATTVERTSLGGQECYKVKLVWHSGRETHDCYGVESGLLVGTMTRQVTNMGTLDAVTLYDDYRSFDGVLMASRITIQVMGVEQVITVDEAAFNEDVEEAVTPPAEIRALLAR
ncbi:MAG TPA: hypothetical protein VK936_06885 [Longimicrobiales bacterium]|nr:hypothetical protein [Longimicrobiales bacterium]